MSKYSYLVFGVVQIPTIMYIQSSYLLRTQVFSKFTYLYVIGQAVHAFDTPQVYITWLDKVVLYWEIVRILSIL